MSIVNHSHGIFSWYYIMCVSFKRFDFEAYKQIVCCHILLMNNITRLHSCHSETLVMCHNEGCLAETFWFDLYSAVQGSMGVNVGDCK